MADYLRDIPNGTMMIRDTGGWVEFWFKTSSSTYNNQQTWGWGANSQYWQGDYALQRGGNWQRFGSVFVDAAQPVLFRIFGEGLGWATTDFVVDIPRGRPPMAPFRPVGAIEWTDHSLTMDWGGDGDTGGLPILNREVWYGIGRDPQVNAGEVPPGRFTIGGLLAGTTYSFWAKTRNALGWSPLSDLTAMVTGRVPDAPNPVGFSNITQTSIDTGFIFTGWDGRSDILEWQTGYGLDPNAPQYFLSGAFQHITNLQRASAYYFWGRGRNAYGWGPWSGRTDVLLNAGAYVNVGGVWKRAVPWVKIDGAWKLAQPTIPLSGTWRVPRS